MGEGSKAVRRRSSLISLISDGNYAAFFVDSWDSVQTSAALLIRLVDQSVFDLRPVLVVLPLKMKSGEAEETVPEFNRRHRRQFSAASSRKYPHFLPTGASPQGWKRVRRRSGLLMRAMTYL